MCCNNILFYCNIFFKILKTKKCVEPGNFLINCQHDLNKLQRKSALNSHIYIHHVAAMAWIFPLCFSTLVRLLICFIFLCSSFSFFSLFYLLKTIIVQDVLKSFLDSPFFTYCIFLAV